MTLTERQQACDLFCFDRINEVRDRILTGHISVFDQWPFDFDEIRESYARIAAKRKCACAYQHTAEQAEILRDVDKLAERCRRAESDCRAARSLLREQDRYDGLVMVVVTCAFLGGMMVMASIQHWFGK